MTHQFFCTSAGLIETVFIAFQSDRPGHPGDGAEG
jgi:hypothetical protein